MLPTKDIIEWYYDFKGGQYGFLLLNTDETEFIRALKLELEQHGISCLKQGVSFKPANNGKHYKTYLTVSKVEGGRPALAELRDAIRPKFSNLHYDASPAEIRAYFNHLQNVIDEKDRIIAARDEQLRALEGALARLKDDLVRQRKQHDLDRQEQLAQLTESDAALRKMIDDEHERYQTILAAAEAHHREELESLTQGFNNSLEQLKRQQREANNEREILIDEIAKLRGGSDGADSRGVGKGRTTITVSELAVMLEELLPQLRIADDSLQFILNEVADRRSICRYLRRLNDKETVPFKKFEAAPGWMEVDKRISDGQSASARIYFRNDKTRGKRCVFVSSKEYQALTARALSRLS